MFSEIFFFVVFIVEHAYNELEWWDRVNFPLARIKRKHERMKERKEQMKGK